MEIDKKYIDLAVEVANRYYATKVENCPAGLARIAEESPGQTEEICDYLKSRPFGTPEARQTINDILLQVFAKADEVGAEPNPPREVIYFSGTAPSNHLLKEAIARGKATEAKQALEGKRFVQGDFAFFKKTYHDVQKGFLPADAPYGKYRPLLSGVDNALMEYCRDKGINLRADNSFAMINKGDADWNIKVLERYNESPHQAKLRMFAVALTPTEAAEECVKLSKDNPSSKYNKDEGARDAVNFAKAFSKAEELFSDITLYDRSMHVIYERKNGETLPRDMGPFAKWKKDCGIKLPEKQQPPNPQGHQR